MKKHSFSILQSALILLWMPIAFSSCEKIIDFDPSMSQPALVLNAVPSADKQLFVNFSYSHLFLDTSNYHPVNNVDMTVYVNGNPLRPAYTNRCNYFFDYTLQEDDNLSIRIIADNDTVTASTYIPRKPDISTPFVFDTSASFRFRVINFNINDHPDYHDYYRITITQRDSGCRYRPYREIYDTIDTVFTTMFMCSDPALTALTSQNDDFFSGTTASILGTHIFTQLLTDDKPFDGKRHNTTLYIMQLRDTNEVGYFLHQYTLNIETITPDRLSYLQSLNQTTSPTQLITEPAAPFSNVNGALGIFAGNAKYTYTLPLFSDTLTNPSSPRPAATKNNRPPRSRSSR